MIVGVMTVGVLSVGALSVGVMTAGVLSVGVMTLSRIFIVTKKIKTNGQDTSCKLMKSEIEDNTIFYRTDSFIYKNVLIYL